MHQKRKILPLKKIYHFSLLYVKFQYQTLLHLACKELKSFFFFHFQMADAAFIAAEHPGEVSIHNLIFYRYRIIYKNERKKMRKISFVYLRKINAALYLSQLVLGTIGVFHLCLKMQLYKLSKILLAEYWWSKLKHAISYKLLLPIVGLFMPFCFRTKQEQANSISPASAGAECEWGARLSRGCDHCSYLLPVNLTQTSLSLFPHL